MPDKFDPYREALVIEMTTIWPEEYSGMDVSSKRQIEQALHDDPENVSNLTYQRLHTGFSREITVTEEDVDRVTG
ncbi:MAG: hypothetical protein GY768_28230 [Planctomycetaceae bacterium]|nr:hypothetical protein [Planctomycetaceae bacterium]